MRLAGRQGGGEDVARAGGGLEAAGAPAAVEEQVLHRGLADDRAGVRGGVDDAAPLAVHAHAGEHREHLDDGLQGVLDHRIRAALAVAVVAVDAGADDQVALVRLADVAVHGVGHDDAVDDRLQRLGNQGLQRVRFDRQAEAGELGHVPGVARGDHADALGADEAAVGLDADYRAVLLAEADDLGLLDQVHAQGVGGAGEAPGHRVVAGHAAAALHGGAHDRVAGALGAVQVGDFLGHLLGVQQLAVHAVEAVGADAALAVAHVLQGVAEVVDAALGEHDVVVEVLGQAFPQLHGVLVELRRLVPQVVGADDGGVARGVAAAQPALLHHRDVADAVFLGQVIGRGQAVAAAADDDHVVHRLGRGRAPHALPVLVVAQ